MTAFASSPGRSAPIRKEANDGGIRVTLLGLRSGARGPVQVDGGFGDAIAPAPGPIRYPAILPGLPAPRRREPRTRCRSK